MLLRILDLAAEVIPGTPIFEVQICICIYILRGICTALGSTQPQRVFRAWRADLFEEEGGRCDMNFLFVEVSYLLVFPVFWSGHFAKSLVNTSEGTALLSFCRGFSRAVDIVASTIYGDYGI